MKIFISFVAYFFFTGFSYSQVAQNNSNGSGTKNQSREINTPALVSEPASKNNTQGRIQINKPELQMFGKSSESPSRKISGSSSADSELKPAGTIRKVDESEKK